MNEQVKQRQRVKKKGLRAKCIAKKQKITSIWSALFIELGLARTQVIFRFGSANAFVWPLCGFSFNIRTEPEVQYVYIVSGERHNLLLPMNKTNKNDNNNNMIEYGNRK